LRRWPKKNKLEGHLWDRIISAPEDRQSLKKGQNAPHPPYRNRGGVKGISGGTTIRVGLLQRRCSSSQIEVRKTSILLKRTIRRSQMAQKKSIKPLALQIVSRGWCALQFGKAEYMTPREARPALRPLGDEKELQGGEEKTKVGWGVGVKTKKGEGTRRSDVRDSTIPIETTSGKKGDFGHLTTEKKY